MKLLVSDTCSVNNELLRGRSRGRHLVLLERVSRGRRGGVCGSVAELHEWRDLLQRTQLLRRAPMVLAVSYHRYVALGLIGIASLSGNGRTRLGASVTLGTVAMGYHVTSGW